jgi:hypothetical protein
LKGCVAVTPRALLSLVGCFTEPNTVTVTVFALTAMCLVNAWAQALWATEPGRFAQLLAATIPRCPYARSFQQPAAAGVSYTDLEISAELR